jgi:hypothetical protein
MYSIALYVPVWYSDTQEAGEVTKLLERLRKEKGIAFNKYLLDDQKENEIKVQSLYGLAVYHKIKIGQTRRTKSLYPVLLVFDEKGRTLTFYPQSRRGAGEITIPQFLEKLLNGKMICLHDLDDKRIIR